MPCSVNSFWSTLATASVFVITMALLLRADLGAATVLLFGVGAMIVFQLVIDLLVRKVHLRESTGLVFRRDHFRRNFSIKRSLVKLAGLVVTLGLLAAVYLLVPIYSTTFHKPFWNLFRIVAPYVVVLVVPYFILIDALMVEPKDGYWHMANLAGFRWKRVDRAILREHLKGWTIKGFFLPLMVPYLVSQLRYFDRVGAAQVWSMVVIVTYISALAVCIDLAFVVTGYTFTFRLLDSHIRNSSPFLVGWLAAIICYRPFWQFVGPAYHDGRLWHDWFRGSTLLIFAWGGLIIAMKLIWAWSSVIFGFRWSNLTNRGIITNGLYRYTKHPCYISKNIGWWLISVPFLSTASPLTAIKHSAGLLAINLVYLTRAMTEEMHLSEDPTYVAYAEWVDKHGMFRWVGRLIPALRFKPWKGPDPR